MEETGIVLAVLALVAAVVVPAFPWVRRQVGRAWRRTGGRKRYQRNTLDRLQCDQPASTVSNVLGEPVRLVGDGLSLYAMPDFWVSVGIRSAAVAFFSITARSPTVSYSTAHHTDGLLSVDLGRDTFSRVSSQWRSGRLLAIGAHTGAYVEEFYCGRLGMYKTFFLTYTEAGSGGMPIQPPAGSSLGWASEGSFGSEGSSIPNVSAVTCNTLTVVGRQGDPAVARKHGGHALHPDSTRGLVARKPNRWAARVERALRKREDRERATRNRQASESDGRRAVRSETYRR